MKSMKLTVIMVLTVLIAAGMGLATETPAPTEDVKIISSDEYGLIIELALPHFEIRELAQTDADSSRVIAALPEAGGSYQRISLAGWAKTTTAGHPELPVKAMLIQVPLSGAISLEVLEETVESLQGLIISPVPRLETTAGGKTQETYNKNAAVYRSADFFPASLAEVSSRQILRDTALARLVIHPFQWNPATRELRYTTHIRLQVHFENPLPQQAEVLLSGGHTEGGDSFERLLRRTVANYQSPAGRSRSPVLLDQTLSARDFLSASTSKRLRFEIRENGIYQLSYQDLLKAGLDPRYVDPRTFQLFNRGKEVAVKVVSSTSLRFRSGDYLEFYGQGLGTTFTDTNVYWLCWGSASGKRIAKISGKVTGKGQKLTSFKERLRFEENLVMWEATPGAPDQDYWFWEKIVAPKTTNYSLSVPSPVAGQADAAIRVGYQGRSTSSPHPDHHTRLSLNGTPVGDNKWDSSIEFTQEAIVPSGLLVNGMNTLTLTAPGDTGAVTDVFYLNWLEIDYARLFEASADTLSFSVSGNGKSQIAVKKLGQSSVRVYEVSDPYGAKELVSFSVSRDGSAYRATFEDTITGSKTYHVAAVRTIKRPEKLSLWQPTNLQSSTYGADLILITAGEFLAAVEPLCAFHRSQGLRVKAVTTEDLYNEFNYGLVDPTAIRDFLKFAYASWKRPAPAYVLLVGDANTDYRDYLGTGKKNRVPVHLSHTADLGVTPDDNWYVCVDGNDSLPDMLIGRIPGSSQETVQAVVNKIVAYEQDSGYQPKQALFVADNNEIGFENLNQTLIGYLPSDFDVHKVYLNLYTDPGKATHDIIAGINEGMLVTNYVGHGDVLGWSGERIFDTTDVSLLNNPDKPTFVVTLDCLNGYFSQPFYYSLGEEFVVAPENGAIASFAPSGLAYLWEHEILGKEVFSSIFKGKNTLLGIITLQSKIDAYAKGASEDILKTFTLLGDPAGRLKIDLE